MCFKGFYKTNVKQMLLLFHVLVLRNVKPMFPVTRMPIENIVKPISFHVHLGRQCKTIIIQRIRTANGVKLIHLHMFLQQT